MFKLVDVHAHVNSGFYGEEWREVLERAMEAGVVVVNVGTNREDSEENVKIAAGWPKGVYATVGLHPTENQEFDFDFYEKLARRREVVAIGECGLDYYRIGLNSDSKYSGQTAREQERQAAVFKEQIRLARAVKKPLMLHLRTAAAYDDAIAILEKEKGQVAAIFHFYVGDRKQTERILEMKMETNFTVGGVITFAREYDEVIKILPRERVMVETDSPFVAPVPKRGRRNEPANIEQTVGKLAELWQVSFEEAAALTRDNARRVLHLKI